MIARRIPALLIVIFIACPLLFASLLTIALGTWTMDRRFSLSLVDDERLYQVTDALSSASWSGHIIEGTGGLQWRSVARAAGVVLTPDYLRGQARRVVNQAFDWLEGRSGPLDISVDAAPIKKALAGDAGRQFSQLLAEDLPVGGSASSFVVKPGRLPISRPSSVPVGRAAAIIQSGLPTFVSAIPDTVPIGNSWWPGPRFNLVGAVLAAGILLLLLAGGFLAAAAFLGGETRFERLQWFGWPLLVPAAGVLLMGLLISLAATAPWVRIHGFSPVFVSALADAARHVVSRISVGFLAVGGIAAGAGLGLLAWSWSIPHTQREREGA
jgi:hypothetical protein